MKDIQNNIHFAIKGDALVQENCRISQPMDTWDLNQLVLIVESQSLDADYQEKVKKQGESSNVAVGALAGGVIGSSVGAGFLKGMAIGGLLGMASKPRPIKFHDSKALVGLIFADNQFLNVELSPEEYTILNTKATLNQAKLTPQDIKPSKSSKTLSKEEKDKILRENHIASVFGLVCILAMLVLMFKIRPMLALQPSSTNDNAPMSAITNFMDNSLLGMAALVAVVLLIKLFSKPSDS